MTVNGSSDLEELKEVSILRATLLKCLTCHLCDSLLRDATTISECLHSFCSDCITAKLSGGETETCPVCEVNLGPLPLEKLRPDHHLDVLKEKLFSKKRKLVVAASNGTRRKERSLSSLGAQGSPALNPGYASRQTRALSSSHDEDEADISDDDSPTTTTQKLEDFFRPDSSDEAKALPALNQNVSEGQGQRTRKGSLSPAGHRFPGFVSGLDALASLSVEPKLTIATPPNGGSRPNGMNKRPSNFRTRRPSSRASSTNGIWFVLESGDLQTNEDALPPLASPYMRVKDGKMSVNHVKQYLVHKLSHKLSSEMDVEITCRGNRVVSSLPVDTIRDIWSAQFSHEAQTKAETSTVPTIPRSKDFLMVLTYKRKTLKP